MFQQYCLLCLILSCRFAIGRLPKDASPIYANTDNADLIAVKFSGVHNIEYVHGRFYVLSKNNVSSIRIDVKDEGGGEFRIEQVISWDPTPGKVVNCKRKNPDSTVCENFIRIFASKKASGREYIVCGTHSTDPQCRTYLKQGNSFRRDTRSTDIPGTSICPYTPKQTGASLYTGGDLYTATMEDLLGRKPGIHRRGIDSTRETLQRSKKDEPTLIDPWFVKFVETTPKVYIFFKETAVEDRSGLTYSRVGQICKREAGGDVVLRRQFTSFIKARLNCSYPGDPPFYFNEIAAASDFYQMPGDARQSIMFAAMNTPKNSIWGSAVCAYTEDDIEQTLQGPFLEQHVGDAGIHYWLEKESDPAVTNALSRCEYDDSGKSLLSAQNLQFIRDHPLKSRSIPSWSKPERKRIPLFMKLHAEYQFSAITVDPSAGSATQYLVLLLGTTDGKILKVIPPLKNDMEEAHFIEESNVYDENQCDPNGDRQVRDIKLDKTSGYILVAFSSCIVSVPMCPHHKSTCKRTCIAAQDPYCGWDSTKCSAVLSPGSLEQDVLGENLEGLLPCVVPPKGGDKGTDGNIGKTEPLSGNDTDKDNSTVQESTDKEPTNSDPEVAAASFEMNWVSLCIGLAIGIAIILLIGIIMCRCRERRSKPKGLKASKEEKLSMTASHHSNEVNRNSYTQKPERPLSNHTQRHHSKRSDSSVEEDAAFVDDKSDGNSNSFEKKSKRKREPSTNRRSNTSYRRDDSIENVAPMPRVVNRQTSRESNESGLNGEVIDATQPPSPPMPGMHRTMSATTAPTRPHGRDLKRQLSLQIASNPHPQMMNFPHSLTPIAMMSNQNPFDYPMKHPFAGTPGPMPPTHFDPSGNPWHQSPMKNSKSMPAQHQTTSLDRKMLRAAAQYNRGSHGVPHDVQQQQQPRGYADTLPSHGIDDPRAQGRKRYPSESVVSSHRPYVAKPPSYQSIEEEATPMPDSPTKFHPNMHQRTTGRRPNQLPLSDEYLQFKPPKTTATPLMEQAPTYLISPSQPTGNTLPATKQVRRVNSEIPDFYTHQGNNLELPHPQSVPTFFKDYHSKSNPTTPDVDPNHNSFFRDQVDPSQVRKRNPSGKSTTPPSGKELSDRPDVIPAAAQPVEITHLEIRQSDQTV